VLNFDAPSSRSSSASTAAQFGGDGYAYQLFLDSAVAKWSLGPPTTDGWKLIELPVHYSIGHLSAARDT
jgi:hypothetical protein